MSAIAATVAATVEEQNIAVASIGEGVSRASVEAKTGAESMSCVAGATIGARATAADVKELADVLAVEVESLRLRWGGPSGCAGGVAAFPPRRVGRAGQ